MSFARQRTLSRASTYSQAPRKQLARSRPAQAVQWNGPRGSSSYYRKAIQYLRGEEEDDEEEEEESEAEKQAQARRTRQAALDDLRRREIDAGRCNPSTTNKIWVDFAGEERCYDLESLGKWLAKFRHLAPTFFSPATIRTIRNKFQTLQNSQSTRKRRRLFSSDAALSDDAASEQEASDEKDSDNDFDRTDGGGDGGESDTNHAEEEAAEEKEPPQQRRRVSRQATAALEGAALGLRSNAAMSHLGSMAAPVIRDEMEQALHERAVTDSLRCFHLNNEVQMLQEDLRHFAVRCRGATRHGLTGLREWQEEELRQSLRQFANNFNPQDTFDLEQQLANSDLALYWSLYRLGQSLGFPLRTRFTNVVEYLLGL
jgi:hypothetical protein